MTTSSSNSPSARNKTKNEKEKQRKQIRRFAMDALTVIKQHWKGRDDFVKAQGQILVVLLIAYIGNNWPKSYPRNDNHNPTMFWLMNISLWIAAAATLKHDTSSNNIVILNRNQTEEWKGWMQFAFIMYHYWRMFSVYNEIRVFVSAYVWMTGFGNFLYFDKKQDFSLERAVSMWIRINYFPILLSVVIGVPFDLFYIVPLHTTAFFITMATCYVATLMPTQWSVHKRNAAAIGTCLAAHVLFYETPLVNALLVFGTEIHFRFQADKYSAVLGIVSGYFWGSFKQWAQWIHVPDENGAFTRQQTQAAWGQRGAGVGLILLWWFLFGKISDKYVYNPIHPFIFWMPIAGWLLLRNSSKYLTELHSSALEFFGRITLETYVLQFHVFMCRNVQHIPVVIPGSGGVDGNIVLKVLNQFVTGAGFVALAWWARKITVTTQMTMTDLLVLLRKGPPPPATSLDGDDNQEMAALTTNKEESNGSSSSNGVVMRDTSTSSRTNGSPNARVLKAKMSDDV